MKINKVHRIIFAVVAAVMAFAAVAPAFASTKKMTIVEIAASNPDFSTLVAAVVKADLVDALDGPKRVTVFAPTNDAFAALPAGTLDSLLADPQGQLTQILLYHVLGLRAAAAARRRT